MNITYKILYNDAVAMTGGQPVEGRPTVPQIAQQVLAEGAKCVVVVSEEPSKYRRAEFPKRIQIHHRDRLDAVQRELRAIPGLTVLIYDQTCAAEKRRRRKRGRFPDPPQRVFINEAVCEGCGDCSEKSSCISIAPVETPWGRKRQIDQSSCNKDFSCLKGFCPSFVTIHGASLRGLAASTTLPAAAVAGLPLPKALAFDAPYGILIAGIGGTGIITLGALLGMAAHLEGKGVTVLDVTGLAQKNGAVMSHVRIAPRQEDLMRHACRQGAPIYCSAAIWSPPQVPRRSPRSEPGATRAVINSACAAHRRIRFRSRLDFETSRNMLRAIGILPSMAGTDAIDATALATALMGDSIASTCSCWATPFRKALSRWT